MGTMAKAGDVTRVLMLHGIAGNARLMEHILKLTGWSETCHGKVEFICVDGPETVQPSPDFYPPFYLDAEFQSCGVFSWNLCQPDVSLLQRTVAHIESLMERHAPIQGIGGFCDGALVAATIAALQCKGKALTMHPPLRFILNIAGTSPKFQRSTPKHGEQQAIAEPFCTTAFDGTKVEIPSIHIIGQNDNMYDRQQLLYFIDHFAFPTVLWHPGKHIIPKLEQRLFHQLMAQLEVLGLWTEQGSLVKCSLGGPKAQAPAKLASPEPRKLSEAEAQAEAAWWKRQLEEAKEAAAAALTRKRKFSEIAVIVPTRMDGELMQRDGFGLNVRVGRDLELGSNVVVGDNVCIGAGVSLGDGAMIGNNVTLLDGAKIAKGVSIQPFCIIGKNVSVGEDTVMETHCVVGDGIRLGKSNRIGSYCHFKNDVTLGDFNNVFSHCVFGDEPEFYADHDMVSSGPVVVGNYNTFRSHVHVGSPAGDPPSYGVTRIGNSCFFMSCTHIAHDAVLEDHCCCAVAVLAGYVRVGHHANIGLNAEVHQFSTIGAHSMVAAGTTVTQDVLPFTIFESKSGSGCSVSLNHIGLRRRLKLPEHMVLQLEDFYATHKKESQDLSPWLSDQWFAEDLKSFQTHRKAHLPNKRTVGAIAWGDKLEQSSVADLSTLVESILRAELPNGSVAVEAESRFVDLGLDSISAFQFRNALAAKLGMQLPGTLIMDSPTFGQLVAFLSDRRQQ